MVGLQVETAMQNHMKLNRAKSVQRMDEDRLTVSGRQTVKAEGEDMQSG